MKIREITESYIEFDDGSRITFWHYQDCCEDNYADFEQIEELALVTEFDKPLRFESVANCGFRFGNLPQKMFFVPCYSEQNGYYTTAINIEYGGKTVLSTTCGLVYAG